MKTINSILAGLLLTASVLLTQQATAQAPQKMSYQSVSCFEMLFMHFIGFFCMS